MAKSIRSKWKRKCRAVKRVRYGEKELERLKKTLANDTTGAKKEEKDKVLADLEQVANVKTVKEIQSSEQQDDPMEEEVKKKFNSKTLRNKDGAYPVWVHPRKVKSKSSKKTKKKNKKKNVKRNK